MGLFEALCSSQLRLQAIVIGTVNCTRTFETGGQLEVLKTDSELVLWAWHTPLAHLRDHRHSLYALGHDASVNELVRQPCFPGAVLDNDRFLLF